VSEWANASVVLDELDAAPGPYNVDLTPYCREIQDAWTDPIVEQLTVMSSTQIGKTRTLLNCVGYSVDQAPGPIMIVQPKEEDTISFCLRKVKPLFEKSPVLNRHITGWAQDWKAKELNFGRAIIYLAGANSPSDLAGKSIRVLVMDEVDKYPPFSGREADPMKLARERVRTFWDRKIFVCSTPTTRAGIIAREFESSDQRRYWVPCPHCRRYQVLDFHQIRYPDDRTADEVQTQRLAQYFCLHCAAAIADADKPRMLRAGVWVQRCATLRDDGVVEGARPSSHRGYHLSALYSPWLRWSEVAAEWIRSQGDPAALMNFINSWLGEVWENRVNDTRAEDVARLVESYEAKVVPAGVVALTAGVDVQKDRLVFVVRGWGKDEESWLIAGGFLQKAGAVQQPGEPPRFQPDWEALEALICRGTFGTHRVRLACIDMGYDTDKVYALCRRWRDRVRPVKGQSTPNPAPFFPTSVDRHPVTGARYPGGLVLWNVNTGMYKDRIARAVQVEPGGVGRFHVHRDPPAGYLQQLSSEHKVAIVNRRNKRSGLEEWVLKPGHRANHFLDCEVYAWAAGHMIGTRSLRSDVPPRPPRRRRPAGETGDFWDRKAGNDWLGGDRGDRR